MKKTDLFELRREVRRSDDISDAATRLFCEVIDLHRLKNGCTATDATLGDYINKSARTVARRRQELEAAGYLREEDGANRRVLVPKWHSDHDDKGEKAPVKSDKGPDKIDETPDNSDEQQPVKSDTHKEININTPERERAHVREDDPAGVRVWVDVTGERPNIQTRQTLRDELTREDGPLWDEDVFRKVLREAWNNVGRDPDRIRVGYLMTSYEQALAREAGGDGTFNGATEDGLPNVEPARDPTDARSYAR